MTRERDSSSIRRRALLASVGSVVGTAGVGSVSADRSEESRAFRRCPDASIGTDMAPCEGASMDGCADDHPETIELREQAAVAIETRFRSVENLIDRDFVPYFDVKRLGDSSGWSHWLSPEYIGDDVLLDPNRPESILVDNDSWRPIGIMFIATTDGEPVDPPPAVYTRDESSAEDTTQSREGNDEESRCSPWHYHRGLPGRFAWKFYRQVYERDYEDGALSIPCRTPCMMHVWTVPHPEGVYAHGAPPPEKRDLSPPDDPGFETDADPAEDQLEWEVLPDSVRPDVKPEDLLEMW